MTHSTRGTRRLRRGTTVAVVAAVAVAAAACSSADPAADLASTTSAAPSASAPGVGEETAAGSAAPGLLYVQRAATGTTTLDGSDSGTLVLNGVDADTVWFQDRPGRDAGRSTTSEFVDGWAADGFADDPPNGALELLGVDGTSSTHVVELRDPRWDEGAGRLEYTITLADGEQPTPASFGEASLFIDDAGSTSYRPVTLAVSNAQPGQRISVDLRGNGVDVAWSTGNPFQQSSGLELRSEASSIPASSFTVNGSAVEVSTSAGGAGGSSLDFSIELFLAADAGIETFFLRSASDPGVEVTAQIGSAQPEAVNQAQTPFSWSSP